PSPQPACADARLELLRSVRRGETAPDALGRAKQRGERRLLQTPLVAPCRRHPPAHRRNDGPPAPRRGSDELEEVASREDGSTEQKRDEDSHRLPPHRSDAAQHEAAAHHHREACADEDVPERRVPERRHVPLVHEGHPERRDEREHRQHVRRRARQARQCPNLAAELLAGSHGVGDELEQRGEAAADLPLDHHRVQYELKVLRLDPVAELAQAFVDRAPELQRRDHAPKLAPGRLGDVDGERLERLVEAVPCAKRGAQRVEDLRKLALECTTASTTSHLEDEPGDAGCDESGGDGSAGARRQQHDEERERRNRCGGEDERLGAHLDARAVDQPCSRVLEPRPRHEPLQQTCRAPPPKAHGCRTRHRALADVRREALLDERTALRREHDQGRREGQAARQERNDDAHAYRRAPTVTSRRSSDPGWKSSGRRVTPAAASFSTNRGGMPVAVGLPSSESPAPPCGFATNRSCTVITSDSMRRTSVMLVTRRVPSTSRSSWMTTSNALAICSRIARSGRSTPAVNTSVSSRESASRGEFAWMVVSEPSWPVFIACSMSTDSGPRTSPTMIRSGRMRSALRTRSRMRTSPRPSALDGRASSETRWIWC